MAITKLTPTDVTTFLKAAYKLTTGTYDATTFKINDIIDAGTANLDDWRDQFTGKLMAVLVKNWFTFSGYREQYKDRFYIDSQEYGAVLQAISIDSPDVIANSAFKTLTSGSTTLGTYTVYLPVVDTKYYVKQSAWAVPITISGEQMNTAFKNEAELSNFVSFCFLAVDNAIIQHLENMNELNRNNFIGAKYEASNNAVFKLSATFLTDQTSDNDILDKVNTWASTASTGDTLVLSRNDFICDKSFLRYATKKMRQIKMFMQKQTKLFNTAGKVRFTPESRIVVQLLQEFVYNAESILQSDTFHDELVKPEYTEVVPYWQRCDSTTLGFSNTSQLSYTNASNVSQTKYGIIGFMCDKWAIMHTIVNERVGVQRFDIEDVTHYEHQFVDKYANDLSQNAAIFVCSDVTITKTATGYTIL